MTARAQDMKAIFSEAIAKATSEDLTTYLDEVCGSDGPLRSEIESLVKAHRQAGAFLHGLLENEPPLDTPISEGPGTMIGRYRLLEKIGEGGMAVVYMAEQTEPIRRRVALKIIKLGMDTQQVIARFEAERQALAMMDHPNIAKVLDAGVTETGRPYFVMELVQGVSITEYCDKKNLSTKDRLGLFLQVCNAVQHAHQKGIIHRDLKPSNVMVTHHDGRPVPKVIDFGIAKATNQKLTEKTLFTRYAQIIGTPAYMSPEQAELSDVDIDTRTDIYSLGVLLYELLTGSPPFSEEELRKAGYIEMQRVIREQEPTKPSTKLSTLGESVTDVAKRRSCTADLLRKTLRGDLDWIVMKALEKDRTRRYDAASALLGDIQHHLRCEPVSAGPPTAWYRTTKFVRRHAVLVTAIAVVVITFLVGLIASTAMYLRAERARTETETITAFLTNDLLASVYPENTRGQEVTVRYILDTAERDLDRKFEGQPLIEAAIRQTLGQTYQKMGDYAAAAPHLERALEIRRVRLGREDPITLTALNNLGWLYWYQGRYDEAEPLLVEALQARARILGEGHPDTLESMSNLGWLYGMRRVEGRIGRAMELHTRVLEIGKDVLGDEHPVMLQSMCDLALEYATARRLDEAEALGTKGLEISRRTLGNEHELTLYQMNSLAWIYGHQRRYDEALSLAGEALDTTGRVVGEEHLAAIWARSIVGWICLEQGRYDEASVPLEESVEISERVFGHTHALTQFFRSRILGLYEQQQRYEELDELLVKAYEVGQQFHGETHLHTRLFRQKLIARLPELGLLGKGQYADQEYETALATLDRMEAMRRVLGLQSVPMELALVAMSLHQLGAEEEAQAALNHLRRICATGDYAYDEGLLYEAEQLLTGDDRALSEAWRSMEAGYVDDAWEILRGMREGYREILSHRPDDIESLAQALARSFCVRAEEAEARRMYQKARELYEIALEADSSNIWLLKRFVRLLATCPLEGIRDGTRAVHLATQACELTAWENPDCLSGLAAACAEASDFLAASQWQKAAVTLLPQNASRTLRMDYDRRLRLYEAKKPYHRKNTLPMVAWWKLDEAVDGYVKDASGNGLDGRLEGEAKIVLDAERGNVVNLEGQGYVDCGDDVAFDITGPITITAWIKVHAFDIAHQAIVTKGNTAWMLDRNFGYDNIRLVCADTTALGHGWGAIPGRKNVNDGHWHHVVGVYDRTTMSLYVDGELDASTSAYGKTSTNDMPVFIGANSEAPERKWKGLIDDVRIYDYALTEAEVRAIYTDQETRVPEE